MFKVEQKVLAVNLMHKYAKEFIEYELKHFNQFIGVNIFKVNGDIKQKYEHEKLSFKGRLNDGTWCDVHYWFTSQYSFDIHVKLCINGGSYDVRPSTAFCHYEEQSYELFKIDKGILAKSERTNKNLDIQYDVTELQVIANQIKIAQKVYESEYEKMPYQFREVFNVKRISY